MSTFVSEFVKRKVAEQSRKPGSSSRKKRGTAAAAAAATPAPVAPAAPAVSAAAVGLVNAGGGNTEAWSRIPKRGAKKAAGGTAAAGGKRGGKAAADGIASKLDMVLLADD